MCVGILMLQKLFMTSECLFSYPQGADLQAKPDGKMTQPVNMVQLLTVRQCLFRHNSLNCVHGCQCKQQRSLSDKLVCVFPSFIQKYPIVWQGLLALKNDTAAVQLHFVCGNKALAHRSLPLQEGGTLLRIVQRMRLEASQLESVARRMTVRVDGVHCP